MVFVKPKPNEDIENLLRRFKKLVDNEGVLSTYKKCQYFEKPSEKRKRKQAAAKKRAAKDEKKRARYLARKRSGPNWKWNKSRTKKIPMIPRSRDGQNQKRGFNNRINRGSQSQQRSFNNRITRSTRGSKR